MIHITPEVDMAIIDLIDSFKTQGAYLAPNQEPPMGVALRALEATIRAYGDARAAAERERCAAMLDRMPGSFEIARAATAIRALANADQPGA